MTNATIETTTLRDGTTVLAKSYYSRITEKVETSSLTYVNRTQAERRLAKLQDMGVDNAWVYQPGMSVGFCIAFD
jgi:hypothetical protein